MLCHLKMELNFNLPYCQAYLYKHQVSSPNPHSNDHIVNSFKHDSFLANTIIVVNVIVLENFHDFSVCIAAAQHGKQYEARITEYFAERLKDKKSLSWVPSLNDTPLHNLKPNTLVKFRCMVQDMFDPEFYLGVYEIKDTKTGQTALRSGRFKDIAQCLPHQEILLDSEKNVTCDRQTLYCIPIPGETDWVKEAFSSDNQTKNTPSTSQKSVSAKRSLEEDDNDMQAGAPGDKGNQRSEVKRARTNEEPGSSSSNTPNLNFPLPGEKGPACLVKVYKTGDNFKLNDIVEFIGILSVDPALAMSAHSNEEERNSFLDPSDALVDSMEHEAHHPPPSLVPRLHVILSQKLQHNNPLLPVDLSCEDSKSYTTAILNEAKALRQHLMFVLETALFGDSLAAEYFLCHLISSVYARRDVIALGKFSINLSGCPKCEDFVPFLHQLMHSLLTKSFMLPMATTNLNEMKFAPKKDYSANRLTSGILQLPERTHLMLDEISMEPGQLNEQGVKNLTAIGNVISWQKVEYDFDFHRQDFLCNIPALAVSEGKSLLSCDCQIPLMVKAPLEGMTERFAGISSYLTGEILNKIRSYLTLLQLLDYNMTEDVQKAVEEDFVGTRQSDPKNMTVEDFHSLLVLARLLSLSFGHTSLNKEVWEKAKALESERKQRLCTPIRQN